MESKSGVTALNPFSYDEDITAAAEPFEVLHAFCYT